VVLLGGGVAWQIWESLRVDEPEKELTSGTSGPAYPPTLDEPSPTEERTPPLAQTPGSNKKPITAGTATPALERVDPAAPDSGPVGPAPQPGPTSDSTSTGTVESRAKVTPRRLLSRRTATAIRNTIDGAAGGAIDRCAAKAGALNDETVTVELRIAPSGAVITTTARGTTLGTRFHDCVATAVRAVIFSVVTDEQRFEYQRKID